MARRHRPVAAALLGAALLATMIGLAWRPATLAAGALTWTAGVLLLDRLRPRYRAIVLLLCLGGVAGVGFGLAHGVRPDWRFALAGNQQLISMMAAISFVRLIAPRRPSERPDPVGRAAMWRTTVAVHTFGAVINLSAIEIVAGRILRRRPVPRTDVTVLTRGYSSAGFWSPFWGGSAAALTYVPTARVPVLMGVGGALAVVGVGLSGLHTARRFASEVNKFRGYPLTVGALRLPASLLAAVLAVHLAAPGVPIVGVITVCAPALAVAVMVWRHPRRTPARLAGQARRGLPAMSGEVAMFLSAGVLTAGFTAVLAVTGLTLPLTGFGVTEAWLLSLTMVVLAYVGVHPVISIAVAAGALAPLHPDPTLFAMAVLAAWGVQAGAGPLSGLNVVLHARFGVDNFRIARWNLGYVFLILALTYPALWLCARWVAQLSS